MGLAHSANDTSADTTAKEASRYLTDTTEVRQAFLIYRDQRTRLILRFANDSSMFTARLLDVTDEDLLLEDLQPRSGMALLRKATEFSLSGRTQGQYVMASNNQVHKASVERGVPYFHVKLPSSLLYQQRRREQRVALSFDVKGSGASITIPATEPTAPNIQSDLVDISSGGCRIACSLADSKRLADLSVVEGCYLYVNDELTITSSVQVRHSVVSDTEDMQECGLEFIRMSVTDRRGLELFIQENAV